MRAIAFPMPLLAGLAIAAAAARVSAVAKASRNSPTRAGNS